MLPYLFLFLCTATILLLAMLITLGWFIKNAIQRAYNRIDSTQRDLQKHVQEDLIMQDRMIKNLDKVLNYLMTHKMVLDDSPSAENDSSDQT